MIVQREHATFLRTSVSFPVPEGSFENMLFTRNATGLRPTESHRIEYTATLPLLIMHPSLSTLLVGLASRPSRWRQGAQSVWNMGIHLFASGHVPVETIHRISILLSAIHLIMDHGQQNNSSSCCAIMDGMNMKLLPIHVCVFLAFFWATSSPEEAAVLAEWLPLIAFGQWRFLSAR